MSKVLEQQTGCPHPDCGSSDAFTIYRQDDGTRNATCFSCSRFFHLVTDDKAEYRQSDGKVLILSRDGTSHTLESPPSVQDEGATSLRVSTVHEALAHPIRGLPSRGISFAVAEKYGVRVGVDTRDGETPIYYLFPDYKSGDITGFVKKTTNPPSYQCIGDCKDTDLFGMHVIPNKGKKLFITEGREDCLSVYQVLKENSTIDWEPAVIALSGSKAKINQLLKHQDTLNNFEEIILVLDSDAPGKETAKEIAKALAGKVFICTLPYKDPNEMLMAGKAEQLKWLCLTGAKRYQPDGIVNAKDMWERYSSAPVLEYYPFPDSMPELNNKLYGAKGGTVVTLGAGTSIGKTAFMRELKLHFLETTNHKIADIELEADTIETLKHMVGLKMRKRITLPDVTVDKEEEYAAYRSLFDDGRYTLYDYFGGMDDDNLFSKLRYFAVTGHKFIFLDHLSIIVSEYAAEGGERERIDTIMTRLAKLAKETGVVIFLVVHLKKSHESDSFEQGAIPTLDDLRGSSSIKQLSWDVIFLSRNTQHPDPYCATVTELTSAKCRLTGRTGNAGFLKFDEDTGRMHSVAMPPNYRLKKEKGQMND